MHDNDLVQMMISKKRWANKVGAQYGDSLKRMQHALSKSLYVKLIDGICPIDRQVSKSDCLAAAKSVGALPWVIRLGGNDAGLHGRPHGCTISSGGKVEWWGRSGNY